MMESPSTPSRRDTSTPTRFSLASAPSTPSGATKHTHADANAGAVTASPANMPPLEPASSERMNKQPGQTSVSASGHDSNVSIHGLASPSRQGHSRDSSVHDKINQFNTLAAVQGGRHERKTADAALKRAVLGREEAEAEARRCRDEVRVLKRQVEEGKERERKVGERLETVMENHGRAKETHAHTQALWEKEIRRTRKETFKSQSTIVKLQEELKSARTAHKSTEENLQREKERSANREQEAFQARYNLVGVQEQLESTRSELEQALERIKTVEQERDAFKTLAKTEEDVARIAAEGRLPLPASNMEGDEGDEFASPRKSPSSRAVSLSLLDVKSSAASEAEIDELTRMWQWEKQRADRANDHIEYLEAECRLHACSCMKKRPRSSLALLSPKRQKRGEAAPLPPLADPSDRMILSENATTIPPPQETPAHALPQPTKSKKTERKDERRATIFLPDEGTFRTVSVEEAEALENTRTRESLRAQPHAAARESVDVDRIMEDAPTHLEEQMPERMLERYSRTPSVEPPSYAVLGPERASLVSLLNVSQQGGEPMGNNDPSMPITPGSPVTETKKVAAVKNHNSGHGTGQLPRPAQRAVLRSQDPNIEMVPVKEPDQNTFKTSFDSRPHTTNSFYQSSTFTTTTTVPLREEDSEPSMAKRLLALQRTPSRGRAADDIEPTWDVNNPALTPTMTREQALAKIRERRGRAKSGQAVTPRKVIGGARGDRRDLSAPAGRKGRIGS